MLGTQFISKGEKRKKKLMPNLDTLLHKDRKKKREKKKSNPTHRKTTVK